MFDTPTTKGAFQGTLWTGKKETCSQGDCSEEGHGRVPYCKKHKELRFTEPNKNVLNEAEQAKLRKEKRDQRRADREADKA